MSVSFEDIRKRFFVSEGYKGNGWQMSMAEGSALTLLLRQIQPAVSIEIGTAEGGSLGIIANYSKRVYSIDINPVCAKQLSPIHPNVEFRTGSSLDILPAILANESRVDFVLVDGDHSYAGAKRDIELILEHSVGKDTVMVMHDSFNPEVRNAILDVDWNRAKHVTYLDLDFVPGIMNSVRGWEGTLWGGLALCIVSSTPRETEKLEIGQLCGLQYQRLLPGHNEVCSRNVI